MAPISSPNQSIPNKASRTKSKIPVLLDRDKRHRISHVQLERSLVLRSSKMSENQKPSIASELEEEDIPDMQEGETKVLQWLVKLEDQPQAKSPPRSDPKSPKRRSIMSPIPHNTFKVPRSKRRPAQSVQIAHQGVYTSFERDFGLVPPCSPDPKSECKNTSVGSASAGRRWFSVFG